MATDEVAKVILIPNSRSHPFVQRECLVSEPQKVGRSVDKRRISPSNLIFDCRVLSRNHALIWFENGKFYIKDTKSSNGTFVNDSRLSHSGDESVALELKSRDIIQFGVNVNVEKRVTHGCIVATIKLLINDKELPGPDPDIQQVMQIVQAALLREQELENKLASMQEVITSAHSITKENMMTVVKEDELLSRLEMLENQLQITAQTTTDDELKQRLSQLIEDKHKEERTTKEAVRSLLQEKIDFQSKLSQLQRDYDKAEEECQRYRTLYDSAKQQHSQEAAKLNEEIKTAQTKFKELETKSNEELDQLQASLELRKEEKDFKDQQLAAMKTRLQAAQDDVTKIQTQVDALSKKEDAVLLAHIQSSVSAFKLERASKTENEDKTGIGADNDSANILVQSGEGSEGVQVKAEPVTMLSASASEISDTTSTLDLELLIVSLQEKLKESEKSSKLFQSQLEEERIQHQNALETLSDEDDSRDVQAGPVSHLPDQDEALAEYKAKLEELINTATAQKEELERRECEVTELKASGAAMEQQLGVIERESREKIEEYQQQNEKLQKQLNTVSQQVERPLSSTTSPAPSPSSESDPRIKILAVITLSSITIAIISVLIAYFF